MGAQPSSERGANSEPSKRDYYEVLGVERQATEEEIKKSYRKKALELHPDRNFGDVENATTKFAEVQTAYEVLSDPQERAWYDSHRESILRGGTGSKEDRFEHNVCLTSAGDIINLIGKFNSSVSFTDSQDGFFGILQQTFANLAREEEQACDWEGLDVIDYPEFGVFADTYEGGVRDFYKVWVNFTTRKTFSWRDAYRSSDAPDRATRRIIDKENKKLRDDGIREFNDAVRALVAFVRKRDPRYTPNSQTEEDRQRMLRDAAATQAARSRAANQAKLKAHVVPDWAKTQARMPEEGDFSESEEEVVQEIECVVCGKSFKSEKQYETHERSKKHIKAVQLLTREMREEDARLNLDSALENRPSAPVSALEGLDLKSELESDDEPASPSSGTVLKTHLVIDVNNKTVEPPTEWKADGPSPVESDTSEINDEYAPRQEVENRLVNPLPEIFTDEQLDGSTAAASVASDGGETPKLGKAKLKRAKKKAKQEGNATQGGQNFKCAACSEEFTSKTKLFDHIKKLDHAQPVPNSNTARGKRKKR